MFLITDKLPALKRKCACYSPSAYFQEDIQSLWSKSEAEPWKNWFRLDFQWPSQPSALFMSFLSNIFCTREHFSPFSLSLSKKAHIPINRQHLCRTPCSHRHLFSAAVLGLLGLGLLDKVDGILLHSFLSQRRKACGNVREKHSGASLQASATLRKEVNHSEPWCFVINNKFWAFCNGFSLHYPIWFSQQPPEGSALLSDRFTETETP